MTLKQVIYGYVEDKNFIGPDNRTAVIAELLASNNVGVDLVGYACDRCGFIYSKPRESCELCDEEAKRKAQPEKTFLQRLVGDK